MFRVQIQGDGIAAHCSQHLLRKAGFKVEVQASGRAKIPAVMIGEPTQLLLQNVLGREGMFAGSRQIRRRIVVWGRQETPVEFPHSAVVIAEQDLLDRLHLAVADGTPFETRRPDWTIYTSRSLLPADAADHQFGSRIAILSAATLAPGCPEDACWTESLEDGWLFLLPGPEQSQGQRGWIFAVGGDPETLLGRSRLIAPQISSVAPVLGSFACHPRITLPLSEPGWTACGGAALMFDPLCGDGVGNAAREAILASAVVQAAARGGDPKALVRHYGARLLAGFQRHLALCAHFYSSGPRSSWWDEQVARTKDGLAWTSSQELLQHLFRYRLRDFELEANEASAAAF